MGRKAYRCSLPGLTGFTCCPLQQIETSTLLDPTQLLGDNLATASTLL